MTELVDLGWLNSGLSDVSKLLVAACRRAGHHPTDTDVGPPHRGLDHRVECKECGYVYHYDSSD